MAGKKLLTYRMQLFGVCMNMLIVPLVLVLCLWRVLIRGVGAFFYVKPRPERPDPLDDEKLGDHVFIRLKVS